MKNIITEIKNKLFEELGVADIVYSTAKDIVSQIIKHAKTIPSSKNGVKRFKNGNFTYSFENKTINISYDLFYVRTSDDIQYTVPSNRGFSSRKNNNEFTLKTTVVYVMDINQYVDCNGTIQHEVEHIYQMIKSGKNLITNKNTSLYNKSKQLRSSQNLYEKIVGTVIYYGNKFEKDAFANAIYKQIMDNPNVNPYETLKGTITYSNINTIKKYVLDNENNKEIFANIIKNQLGKNYNWFLNLSNKVVKTYINKIGKVFAKAHNDLNNENSQLDGGTFGPGEELLIP